MQSPPVPPPIPFQPTQPDPGTRQPAPAGPGPARPLTTAARLCVTGTDTDSGKTTVTAALARAILSCGRAVLVIKALQTGCANPPAGPPGSGPRARAAGTVGANGTARPKGNGRGEPIGEIRETGGALSSPDLDVIGQAAPGAQTLVLHCFSLPCSPHLAARLDGKAAPTVSVLAGEVERAAADFTARHPDGVILLEGAGSLYTPINERETFCDLFSLLGWPLLAVAPNRLGTVGQLLAVVEAARARSLSCPGFVLVSKSIPRPVNGSSGSPFGGGPTDFGGSSADFDGSPGGKPDGGREGEELIAPALERIIADDNPVIASRLGRLPCLGRVPYLLALAPSPETQAGLNGAAINGVAPTAAIGWETAADAVAPVLEAIWGLRPATAHPGASIAGPGRALTLATTHTPGQAQPVSPPPSAAGPGAAEAACMAGAFHPLSLSEEMSRLVAEYLTPSTVNDEGVPAPASGPFPRSLPPDALLAYDRDHLWHPYTSATRPLSCFEAVATEGARIRLRDGRELIDGMASWWCAIHGYRHPALMDALDRQSRTMPHVMFGGLTHFPAVDLARKLVGMAPEGLERVFLADSGSVGVEVALKMALQYHQATGSPRRTRLLTVRGGYHGDTIGAMSVCDPVSGMHGLFSGLLPGQLFAPRPDCPPHAAYNPASEQAFEAVLAAHAEGVAAVILEPLVQGAGGMRFYHPDYLRAVRRLCDDYGCLLILDEIATGFGRTGALFACEHARVIPDIMCVGKGLTGGVLSLAATLATERVARGISRGGGVLMHGPTYMGNPLACAVGAASLDLLGQGGWKQDVARIEGRLLAGLGPCADLPGVAEARVFGAIGVLEMERPVNVERLQAWFVDRGVWIRPFGNLIYVMPPFVTTNEELAALTGAMREAVLENVW